MLLVFFNTLPVFIVVLKNDFSSNTLQFAVRFTSVFYTIKCIIQFRIVHTQVVCLDVTSGGLGMSVCSQNKLYIWETSTGIIRVIINV